MSNKEYTIWAMWSIASIVCWLVLLLTDVRACLSALGGMILLVIALKVFEHRSYAFRFRGSYLAGAVTAMLSNAAIGINLIAAVFYAFLMMVAVIFIFMIIEDYTSYRSKKSSN